MQSRCVLYSSSDENDLILTSSVYKGNTMRVTHAGLHLCRSGTFKMQDVFDMVYSLLVFVNIRVILYKTYVVLICGKYNTLTLEFKINIAICVPLHIKPKIKCAIPVCFV